MHDSFCPLIVPSKLCVLMSLNRIGELDDFVRFRVAWSFLSFSFFRKKSVHVHGRLNVSRVRFCVFTFLIVFPTCRCLDLDSESVLTRTSAFVIAVPQWNFVT